MSAMLSAEEAKLRRSRLELSAAHRTRNRQRDSDYLTRMVALQTDGPEVNPEAVSAATQSSAGNPPTVLPDQPDVDHLQRSDGQDNGETAGGQGEWGRIEGRRIEEGRAGRRQIGVQHDGRAQTGGGLAERGLVEEGKSGIGDIEAGQTGTRQTDEGHERTDGNVLEAETTADT